MRVQAGQLVSLGHGKYARSEEVVAIEPIVEARGPGRRTRVWVRGLPEPLIASRAEDSLVRDLVTPTDETVRLHDLALVVNQLVGAIEALPPVLLRVLEEETGQDLARLVGQVKQVLA